MKRFHSAFFGLVLLFTLFPVSVLSESGTPTGTVYLAFTSDVHNVGTDPDANSAKVLGQWIRGVSHALGDVSFSSMGFCGDYGKYANTSAETYWQQTQTVMDVMDAADSFVQHTFYIRGNHETDPGRYARQPIGMS